MELRSYDLFVRYDMDYFEIQYCTLDSLFDDFNLANYKF